MSLEQPILTDFLDQHEIAWMPINLDIIDDGQKKKKILKPYPGSGSRRLPKYTDFWDRPDLVEERKRDYQNLDYVWIDTSNVFQMDVDGAEAAEEAVSTPLYDTPYFLSVGKGYPHYFVKSTHPVKKMRCDTTREGVELLCGQGAYAKADSEVYNATTPICIIENILEHVKDIEPRDVLNVDLEVEDDLSEKLNTIFNTYGSWSFNLNRSLCKPTVCGQCLVDPTRSHSTVQCSILVGPTKITQKCFACGSKPLQASDHKQLHAQLRQYFGFSTQSRKKARTDNSLLNLQVVGIDGASGDEEKIGWDEMVKFVDVNCDENRIRVRDGNIMKPSETCEMDYVVVASIEDFLDDLFVPTSPTMLLAYKRPTMKDNLVKYIKSNHVTIKRLERDLNIIAFNNGVLYLDSLEFHEGIPQELRGTNAKAFIPFDLDPDTLSMSWDEIETPVFDSLIKSQPEIWNDPEAKLTLYGLLGALHYENGQDNIQVCPILVGNPGSGKSKIVEVVCKTFSDDLVGLVNYKEKTFGKTAFLDKPLIVDTDAPADLIQSFGKTEWQKSITAESIPIPEKNRRREHVHKCTNRQIYCSQYRQSVKDTGEVMRRIAYFDFVPVEKADSTLFDRIIANELHLVLIRILLARQALLEAVGTRRFDQWGFEYFDTRAEDALMQNNTIEQFMAQSDTFLYTTGARCAFDDFKTEFVNFFSDATKRPQPPKMNDVTFAKLGFKIRKEMKCKLCANVVANRSAVENGINVCMCSGNQHGQKRNVTKTYFIENMEYRPCSRLRSDSLDG